MVVGAVAAPRIRPHRHSLPPAWRNPQTAKARERRARLLDRYLRGCLAGCPGRGHTFDCKRRLADVADAFAELL